MTRGSSAPVQEGVDTLLLIVVGAHLHAELMDRPQAYRLRDWIAEQPQIRESGLEPLVCSDLWFLNDTDLMVRPSIVVGAPGFNAATAYFAHRLPTALALDDAYQIQLDPEYIDLHACIWGSDSSQTERAIDQFIQRYGAPYLEAAMTC